MISIQGIDHVVLRTDDVEGMIHFYCDVLGCLLERRVDEAGLIQLRAGQALIDLVDVHGEIGRKGGPAPGVDGYNMDHLCLRLASFNPTAIAAHLKRHGIEPGPVERRYGAEGFGPSIYLADPDGNTVELKGPPES